MSALPRLNDGQRFGTGLIGQLIERAGDATLQKLLGGPALRLIGLLDQRLIAPAQLRDLVRALHSPDDMLRDPDQRAALLRLLTPEEATDVVKNLGLHTVGEPYGALTSLKIRRDSPLERRLFQALNVNSADPDTGDERPACEQLQPAYALYPHQLQAARRVLQALHREPQRVLLHMPTGAGKTRTAMHVIASHLSSSQGTVVTWLAYSAELCEQAASEFVDAWTHLGDRQLDVYRYWGGRELDPLRLDEGLLVAGLDKVLARAAADSAFLADLSDQTSLVVIDEAHQAIAPSYRHVLDAIFYKQPRTSLLGLTATPGRTWSDVGRDAELAAFFGQQKVTLSVEGYPSPVEYLIDQGYLARPQFESLLYRSGLTLSATDRRNLAGSLDVPQAVLRKLGDDEQRNLVILQRVEELLADHRRILVFAASVDHAHLIATVLRARGHSADAITASTNPTTRARLIARFRSTADEPRVLCNYGVLTTGFDAPATSAAVIARPTRSLVLYSQMVGRATRGTRVGGNSTARIVTVVDHALPGFGDLGQAFANWEDVWL
jgi:superfamily II DNA or RNA helicase